MGKRNSFIDASIDLSARAIIGAALALPYRKRVNLVGALSANVLAPLAGFNKRIRDNLAYTCPNLPESEIKRIVKEVSRNVGRNLIETYSGNDFKTHAKTFDVTGPGLTTLEAAKAAGKPVVFISGHIGSYDAPRAALIAQGYRIGVIYKPMSNPRFNEHYVNALSTIGDPTFSRSRKGLGEMMRFLKTGGMVGILNDQHLNGGVDLTFFGKTARTPTSAAEMSLRYDAPLLPIFGLRKSNGIDFEMQIQNPIAPSDPTQMTQEFNDRLEALVRENMDQWFWIHRRWNAMKPRYNKD
ncbi:MAG: lysophospholipid acyltransferase family protein [Pseudoruegeria sp.]